MGKLKWGMRACGVLILWGTAAVALPAQTTAVAPAVTFTTVHSFTGTDGNAPRAGLVQATDGNFYGTTYNGGANGFGTVFKSTTGGVLATVYNFCSQGGSNCTDGAGPYSGLAQGTDGNFYGTTQVGGLNNAGTVFKITPNGTLTTLHSFDHLDGGYPDGGLVQATDGNFYGTTSEGGTNTNSSCTHGCGTVFSITPNGTLTTLYKFCSQVGSSCSDGSIPLAGLVQDTNGKFYGTTQTGGANIYYGTVFKITPSGMLTTLHSFDYTDGSIPSAVLIQAANGNLYGTTSTGGDLGTVFKITPGGTLTTLHNFDGTDGAYPGSALVQATDGNFYGTTHNGGGGKNGGTVFKITPSGALTTLYSFCSQSGCVDGGRPEAGLIQDTNGTFYGTTSGGGANGSCNAGSGCGTVFSLSVGLGPFVKTNPVSGNVGATVTIIGTKLTGATKVTFHGIAAAFTVVSKSEITTAVPTGATTGTVQVVTPSGTLSSNVPFQVLP